MSTTRAPDARPRPRVVVAGAGIAALEAVLALRASVPPGAVEIVMLAPNRDVAFPPLSVLEPFTTVPGAESTSGFATDAGVELRHGLLDAVDVGGRVATTSEGAEMAYDALLVAVGARADRAFAGGLLFRGSYDAPQVAEALDDLAVVGRGALTFVVPSSVSWSLPAYELALLSAASLGGRGAHVVVTIITHEAEPLEAFGPENARLVARRLLGAGVRFEGRATVARAQHRHVELTDGRRVHADVVVSLPELHARTIAGLPGGATGFVPTDAGGRVLDAPHVYAAGDVTAGAFKQGGLACQQADAAAASIAEDLGFPCSREPFRPVLRGVLVSDGPPEYLRRVLGPHEEPLPDPGDQRPVRRGAWPAGKVVGRHLGPYLARRAEGPDGPDTPMRLPTPSA